MKARAFSQVPLLVCFCPLLAAQGPARGQQSIVLKQDTKVDLKLDHDLSSATANKGQKIHFSLADDVAADGRIVALKGTEVDIEISHMGRARANDNCTVTENGWMQLGEPTIRLEQGVQIQLDEETKAVRAQDDSRGFPWGFVLFAPIQAPIAAVALMKEASENAGQHQPAVQCSSNKKPKEFEMKQGAISSYYVKHDVKLPVARFPLMQQKSAVR